MFLILDLLLEPQQVVTFLVGCVQQLHLLVLLLDHPVDPLFFRRDHEQELVFLDLGHELLNKCMSTDR